ncbi:hypothetical protein Tco_0642357 [Tanacetum coccineum]
MFCCGVKEDENEQWWGSGYGGKYGRDVQGPWGVLEFMELAELALEDKTASTRVITIRAILDNKPQNTKHEIIEEASLITTTLIRKKKEDKMDKHGLPPTKRLFKSLLLTRSPITLDFVERLKMGMTGTDNQEKDKKESQKQTNPSTKWKGQSQRNSHRRATEEQLRTTCPHPLLSLNPHLILRFPTCPDNIIYVVLFPFSLEGAARIWLEKEPPRSIQTWDDLVAKFFNLVFPLLNRQISRTRNTISNKDLISRLVRLGIEFKGSSRDVLIMDSQELHNLIHFTNALNVNDQDSLNSAAGGNFLDKRPADCSSIIESKSKVRHSRSKAIVAKVSTSASTSGVSPDVAELKDMVRALLLDKQTSPVPAPAPVKAVEQSCVTCGGAHSYRNCPATDSNNYRDNIQEYV